MTSTLVWSAILLMLLGGSALMFALSLRLDGVLSTSLAVYLIGVGEVVLLGFLLSPLEAVDRVGYCVGLGALLFVSAVSWHVRGRHCVPIRWGRALTALRLNPAAGVAVMGCLASFVYSAVVGAVVAPNNRDALTYHLTKAIVWYQRHGIGWIDAAPTARLNEFPGNAEVQVLFTLIMSDGDRMTAAPQFVAALTVVGSIFGLGRCAGFSAAAAAFAAGLFGLASVVALEAGTAQNDLCATALVTTAAYFVLRRGSTEAALAGAAIGIALGTKLTVLLAIPVVAALMWLQQRWMERMIMAASAVLTFCCLGGWWFVMNLRETGRVLGTGEGRVEHQAGFDPAGWLATLARLGYRVLEVPGFGDGWPVYAAGAFAATLLFAVAGVVGRTAPTRLARGLAGFVVGLSLPAIVLAAAILYGKVLFEVAGTAIDRPETTGAAFTYLRNRRVDEDLVFFGPVTVVALVFGAFSWRGLPYGRRIRLAFAVSVPVGLAMIAVLYRYNPWLGRFLLLPAALAAALMASLHRFRDLAVGIAAAGVLAVSVAQLTDLRKAYGFGDADPFWTKTRNVQISFSGDGALAAALDELDRLLPGRRCVGVVVGGDDPTAPIAGPHFDRYLVFLEPGVGDLAAIDAILSRRPDDLAAMRAPADWRVSTLADYWYVAQNPRPTNACEASRRSGPRTPRAS